MIDETMIDEPLRSRLRIIDQLHEVRVSKGLSALDIERITGIDNSNLSKIEKQHKNITIDTVITLARALALKVVLIPADADW